LSILTGFGNTSDTILFTILLDFVLFPIADTSVKIITVAGTVSTVVLLTDTVALFVDNVFQSICDVQADSTYSGTVELTGIGNVVKAVLTHNNNEIEQQITVNYIPDTNTFDIYSYGEPGTMYNDLTTTYGSYNTKLELYNAIVIQESLTPYKKTRLELLIDISK
jgi:hypothetical protein